MNDEQDEAPLDPRLAELARSYHQPPAAPRDAMWQAIEARRRGPAVLPFQPPRRRVVSRQVLAWSAGIAALLLLGIGIGRMTAPGGAGSIAELAGTGATRKAPSTALEFAAVQHLSQAEAYLTLFRASVRSGQVDSLPVATARELLATNRLLLDSPAADARLRPLLLDLELVLAEITQLDTKNRDTEIQLITDGLDQGDMMTRLRVVPARSSYPIGVL